MSEKRNIAERGRKRIDDIASPPLFVSLLERGIKKKEVPFPSISDLFMKVFKEITKDGRIVYVSNDEKCIFCSDEEFEIIRLGLNLIVCGKSFETKEEEKAQKVLTRMAEDEKK